VNGCSETIRPLRALKKSLMKALLKTEFYTVADYRGWPPELRCELIDGVIYAMAPAPSIPHQSLSQALALELGLFLKEHAQGGGGRGGCGLCKLLTAPVDVVLDHYTVVQPDLIIVCDPGKLSNGKYVDGPPDLVVEILSPSTALKDKREKRRLYERHGVPEYLIIDPLEFYAEHYLLDAAGHYGLPSLWGAGDALRLALLPTLDKNLGEWFGWPQEAE
jgi:Uma2 family endonuclease